MNYEFKLKKILEALDEKPLKEQTLTTIINCSQRKNMIYLNFEHKGEKISVSIPAEKLINLLRPYITPQDTESI